MQLDEPASGVLGFNEAPKREPLSPTPASTPLFCNVDAEALKPRVRMCCRCPVQNGTTAKIAKVGSEPFALGWFYCFRKCPNYRGSLCIHSEMACSTAWLRSVSFSAKRILSFR